MVALLEPMRPHRHRAVRLLEVSGLARNPRFGARQAIPNLRACRRDYRPWRGYTSRDRRSCEGAIDDTVHHSGCRKEGSEVAELLQKQLSTYNDLHLTLKHVHWNVVGPNFIGVQDEMIDPQVELVRGYADEVAERIAALGKSLQGTPGAIIKDRTWDDYSVGRDTVQAHLGALDLVYTGVIEDTRKAIDRLEDLDLVSQDMFIDHAAELEKFQWFVRASGELGRSAVQPGRHHGEGRGPRREEESSCEVAGWRYHLADSVAGVDVLRRSAPNRC